MSVRTHHLMTSPLRSRASEAMRTIMTTTMITTTPLSAGDP